MGSRNKEEVAGQCVRSSEERGRGEGSGPGAPSLLTTLMSVWKLLSAFSCVGVGASGSRLQSSKGAEAKCEIGLYHYKVDKTDRTDLGKCIHLCDETEGNNETQALSTENCLRQVQDNRQIIIKEEGSKEEDRQEEADVKTSLFF